DLLEQLEAKVIFKNGKIILEVKDQQYVELLSLMMITKEIEVANEEENFKKIIDQVFPGVWARDMPGRAKNALPVQIKLREGGQPYQAILVEQDDVEIVVTNIVNPASFLSGSMGEPVIHDCLETIEATYSSRPDLKDTRIEDAETWFTDGSSYVVSGKRHAGYAVTASREVIESGPLPTNTSVQKAKIIALIRALELAKGKEINIYTDSRYAFGVVHAHGAIWKKKGLLNSQGKSIKHSQEILKLLDAVQLPKRVAIMHIRLHQKVSSELEEGNMLVDREAKDTAKGEVPDETIEAALIPDGKISIEGTSLTTTSQHMPFCLALISPLWIRDSEWHTAKVARNRGTWHLIGTESVVVGDCKYTPPEIEITPGKMSSDPEWFVLWLRCTCPPVFLAKGQIVAQLIPDPQPWQTRKHNSGPQVNPVIVIDENRPEEECQLKVGGETKTITGLLDTGADITIVPEHM
ncbi:hypothetical protein HGM15179_020404, partial [Zosterops borbonicus]